MRGDFYDRFEVDITKFTQGDYLGGGSYGEVYEVDEKANKKRKLAAKIFKYNEDDDSDDGNIQLMIKRELEILMFVSHPTIVKFYGFSNVDFHKRNNITILIEYYKNGSLQNLLKKIRSNIKITKYTNTTRQILLAGIARGMKYLHDCNIIHRDLKPDNILINDDFEPKITDFGLKIF